MSTPQPRRPSFAPRHWPGWTAVALIWLTGQLPQRAGIVLSAPLGGVLMRTLRGRRRVAQRNIDRCFPELSTEQRRNMLRRHFRALARMLFETAWVWAAPARRLNRWGFTVDAHHANDALASGRGVMLLTAHSTSLELGGWFAAHAVNKPWAVYRPLNNAVLEWYSCERRKRFVDGMISKHVFLTMVNHLSDGGLLWYAPDQDFGARRSEFAPFFGIQAATLAALVSLVEKSHCVVVPMFTAFDEESRKYVARFLPPLENFPSGDTSADLARVNALMEQHIRQWPHQYWWIHRRFKTRPPGEPPFYD